MTTVSPAKDEVARVFRHKKRGTLYTLIGVGRAQGTLNDEDPVVLYRGEDGGLWVRHQVEFSDGRFEEVPSTAAMSPVDRLREALEAQRERYINAVIEDGRILLDVKAWLKECHDWLLERDLDMQCPMELDPLDLIERIDRSFGIEPMGEGE